jgi:hypothetical protein
MDWKMLLACITGSVDEDLLLRNEYLVTENRILHQQFEGRVRLTDAQRQPLAEIGKKLSKQALEEIATIVKPETSNDLEGPIQCHERLGGTLKFYARKVA